MHCLLLQSLLLDQEQVTPQDFICRMYGCCHPCGGIDQATGIDRQEASCTKFLTGPKLLFKPEDGTCAPPVNVGGEVRAAMVLVLPCDPALCAECRRCSCCCICCCVHSRDSNARIGSRPATGQTYQSHACAALLGFCIIAGCVLDLRRVCRPASAGSSQRTTATRTSARCQSHLSPSALTRKTMPATC